MVRYCLRASYNLPAKRSPPANNPPQNTSRLDSIRERQKEERRKERASAPNPNLGDRFRLALKLSEFCLHIHSCGWLHKGLRPENILFFSDSDNASELSGTIERPYVVGFEYSRKEGAREITESVCENVGKRYGEDIYGCCSLARRIGQWRAEKGLLF